MVISFKYDLKGLKELEQMIKSADKKIQDRVNKAIKKVAWIITSEVKKGTPVDTGRLRRSIHPIIKHLFADIFTNVEYGIYVEDGTKYMKGVHMFKNVADKFGKQIPQMVLNEIKKAI